MNDSPTENPNPHGNISPVLKAAIWGAILYGGITLAYIWWSSYQNYDFGSVSIVGLIVGILPFIVSHFIDNVSQFIGIGHFASIVTDTRPFGVIVNGLIGALVGYWIGCETRNRKHS